MKSKQRNPGGTLEEQAGYWVLNQHSQQWTPVQQSELRAWLAQSENHRREYARALAIWQQLERFKSASFPARQAAQRQRTKHIRRRQVFKSSVRAMAGVTLAVLLAFGVSDRLSTMLYRTGKGQQQTVALADGSVINLNTDTELQVKITRTSRSVRLIHGEAFFTVSHDENRPFEVIAAQGRIRDIGTRFNIYNAADYTQVTVTEGEVEVMTKKVIDPASAASAKQSQLLLDRPDWGRSIFNGIKQLLEIQAFDANSAVHITAGQQLAYNNQGELGGLIPADASQVTSWREGRLVFELSPLAEVATQIARYHPIDFQFTNAKLKDLKVSASFNTGNLQLILSTLQATFPIKVEWLDDHHIRIAAARR
jgi:transmembrane sensor